MANEIDRAQDTVQDFSERSIQQARAKAAEMPKGNPGDCELCGEWSGRLVQGVCAPCRDKHNLP